MSEVASQSFERGAAFAAIRRLARPRPSGERCDLCSANLSSQHAHLFDPVNRQIVCACEPCAILFDGGPRMKFRRIPKEIELLTDLRMTDDRWAGLGVPIALAFFFNNSVTGEVSSLYPSPAGPTEARLPTEAWEALVAENPILKMLRTDVEALLVNRVHGAREYYRAPIDQCFALVGLIRTQWRGISGGSNVWASIESFFSALKSRATVKERRDA